jgi:hypothetical protein
VLPRLRGGKSKSRTTPATYLDGPRQCHVGGMVLGHPHADATYRIVPRDRAYGVEVSIANSNPTMVTSFATEQDAQRWIAEHKRRATSTPTVSKRPKLIKSGGDAAE